MSVTHLPRPVSPQETLALKLEAAAERNNPNSWLMREAAKELRKVGLMIEVTPDMIQDARLIRSYYAERNWPDVGAVHATDRLTSIILRAIAQRG